MTDERNSSTPEPPLESWKAIAAHLSRDVRTVKRWEKNEGLPVRRYLHQARSSVYAFASELDAWRAARAPRPMQDAPAPIGGQVLPRFAFAAVLFLALSTPSGVPNVARAAAQRTGTSLTEIFSAQLSMSIDSNARFSPDGKRVAATDSGYLVVADVDTEKTTRLTGTNWNTAPYGFAESPVWSPDGKRIAYGWFFDYHYELRVIPAAGGQPQVLFNRGSFYPSDWSPDGEQILGWLIRAEGGTSLAVVSTAGEMTELRTWERALPTAAMFSPDGRHVAYGATIGGSNLIFLLSLDTKTETPLTSPRIADRLPVWSPDGHSLLFVSDRSGRADLWGLPVREGKPDGEARIIYADIGDVRAMCGWDGRSRLVFTRQVSLGQLYTLAVDPSSGATLGSPERPVSQFEGKHLQAVWSPDARRVALLAQTRERGAVYVATAGTGEIRELGTRELGWTRIAGWLPSGDAVALSALPAQGTPGVYLVRPAGGAPEVLHEDRQMNWATAQLSRDGTSLVYVRSASGGAATVRVVDLTRKQTVREIALQPGEVYNGVTWSPDGRAIYGLLGSRVLRVPLPSGEPQEVIQGRFRSLAVSPDGRTLALTGNAPTIEGGAGSERYELYVASSSGGELKRVRLPDAHNPWRVRWSPDGKLGYISLQVKSQFLRLSDFLPRRE
jgi:Tol biopolymer transport system component